MAAGVLELIDETSGAVLDTVTLDDGGLRYATRQAEPVLAAIRESMAVRGMTDRLTFDLLEGWTDGRIVLESVDPDAPPRPAQLLTLAEAGDAHDLKSYWVRGKGAAKIRWGTGGDFNRCVRHLGKYVTDPKGLCNTYHVAAVGAPPGKGH